ncbi:DMT family transporter [Lysinibacillus antri]|nr:DMT family transporter [Lysinibacillus antri]
MELKANILMVIVTMFWGLSYTFMVIGLETLDVFNTVALRSFIAFVIAALIFYKKLFKINKKTIYFAMIQGFLLVFTVGLPMFGLSTTSASNAGFLVSLTVVLVPILASIIDKQLPSKTVSIAIICTMIGISVLTINSTLTFQLGDIYCLLTAFAYSIYIIINGKITKSVDSISFGIYQMGFAAIIGGVFCLLFESPQIPTTSSAWIAVLGLGILCSAFGFIGQTVAQQHTSATATSLIFSLEPIFAAIFAVIFLGEIVTIKLLIGGLFIFGGNIIAQLEHFQHIRIVKKASAKTV